MNQPENMTLQATVQKAAKGGKHDSGKGNGRTPSTSLSDLFAWPGRIVLLLAVILAPWMMGSVSPWAQRWLMIGLLFSLAFWWFETALNERRHQIFPYLFFPVFIGLLIGLLQTVTIPSWLSGFLLGGQLEIYQQFSGDAGHRVTISLDREGTWDQIRLLIIAISGLLLGCRYFRTKRDIVLLMSVIVVNGVALSFFSIIHKLTADYGTIYWVYEMGVRTEAYGPYVNPNNCAGYLLLCLACGFGLLPIIMSHRVQEGPQNIISKEIPIWRQFYFHALEFLAELTAAKASLLMGIVFICFGVAASLSRGAVVALAVGGVATMLLYGMARKPKNTGFIFLPLIGLVLALCGWIGVGEKMVAKFEEIDMVNVEKADLRIQLWRDMIPAIGKMGPFGSGLGSHKGVHRLYRTIPERTLFVYAENQYIQAVIEAGWPGLLVFLFAWVVLYLLVSKLLKKGQSPTTVGVGTMGVFLLFSQAIASIFDFGFYIASNMLLMAVLVGFISYQGQSLASRMKKKSWLDYQLPNYMIQVLLLGLFAAGTLVALDLHRRSALDVAMRPRAKKFDRDQPTLEETETKIANLGALVPKIASVEAMNYMGELWMHRSRLMLMQDAVKQFPEFGDGPNDSDEVKAQRKKEREERLDLLWELTHLQRTQEARYYNRTAVSKYEETRFMNQPAFQENLNTALKYFEYSRRESPLQPTTHLRLGLIKGTISPMREGDVDIERAISLAPFNSAYRELAGTYYLQSDNVKSAIPHLARALELKPTRFKNLMNLMMGRSSSSANTIPEDQILNQVLPENDADMLYHFAVDYLSPESPSYKAALDRSEELLVNAEFSMRKDLVLLGFVCEKNGKFESSAKHFKSALLRQPNDPFIRHRYGMILEKLGRLDDALKEGRKLAKENPKAWAYTSFLRRIEEKIEQQEKQDENRFPLPTP